MGSAGSAQRQCSRFRQDGTRCTNLTANQDGWCRQDGCAGHRRARAEAAPPNVGTYFGTPGHVASTTAVPAGLDADEAVDVRVSQRALDSFRHHHGGSESAARTELVVMLEDFLLTSARALSGHGYLRLGREGYELVLSPDRQVLVGYRTVHRERTWQQVRAGVPSRFGKGRFADYPAHLAADGPAVPADQLLAQVDAAQVGISRRAMRSWFAHMRRSGTAGVDTSHSDVEEDLRSTLARLLREADLAQVSTTDSGVHVLRAGGTEWLITADGRGLIGHRRPAAPEPSTPAPGGAGPVAEP